MSEPDQPPGNGFKIVFDPETGTYQQVSQGNGEKGQLKGESSNVIDEGFYVNIESNNNTYLENHVKENTVNINQDHPYPLSTGAF